MRQIYDTKYHKAQRENNNRCYEGRGRLTKKIRYLEKKLGIEAVDNIKMLSHEDMLKRIEELQMELTKKKMNKIMDRYKEYISSEDSE
jgi:hypothetical protein